MAVCVAVIAYEAMSVDVCLSLSECECGYECMSSCDMSACVRTTDKHQNPTPRVFPIYGDCRHQKGELGDLWEEFRALANVKHVVNHLQLVDGRCPIVIDRGLLLPQTLQKSRKRSLQPSQH